MKNDLLPISAVVLTKNEADNVLRCISSLSRFAEILLLDDSTDETVSLAKKISGNRLRVISTQEEDFSRLRNLALSKVRQNWAFFVDADEEVTIELVREIGMAIKDESYDGYFLKRRDYFLGKWLQYGEAGDIKLLKLGRADAGQWRRRVHETWEIQGRVGQLETPLFHYPHPTVAEFLSRINRWTTLNAKEFYDQGVHSSFWQIIFYPKAKFVLNYVVRRGFLDGMPGLIMALMMSFHSFLTRAKLYQLQNKK